MAFTKGQSGNPNGRPAGSQNKLTASAKEAFAKAFNEIGGAEALAGWAQANRTEFYKLFARLIPTELSGPDGAGIPIAWPLPKTTLDK